MTLKTFIRNHCPEIWQGTLRKYWLRFETFPNLWDKAPASPSLLAIALEATWYGQHVDIANHLCDRLLTSPGLDGRLVEAVAQFKHWNEKQTDDVNLLEALVKARHVWNASVATRNTYYTDQADKPRPSTLPASQVAALLAESQACTLKCILEAMVKERGSYLSMACVHLEFCKVHGEGPALHLYEQLIGHMRAIYKGTDECKLVATQPGLR